MIMEVALLIDSHHKDFAEIADNKIDAFFQIKEVAEKFKINLDIDSADYFDFFHGVENTSMYVKPGDKVELVIDTKVFDETIQYQNSEESNFLAKKYLITESYFSDLIDLWNVYEQEDSVLLDIVCPLRRTHKPPTWFPNCSLSNRTNFLLRTPTSLSAWLLFLFLFLPSDLLLCPTTV